MNETIEYKNYRIELANDAKATIDRLPLIHDAAYAKKAGALHV